jgi:hypothetical protein
VIDAEGIGTPMGTENIFDIAAINGARSDEVTQLRLARLGASVVASSPTPNQRPRNGVRLFGCMLEVHRNHVVCRDQ